LAGRIGRRNDDEYGTGARRDTSRQRSLVIRRVSPTWGVNLTKGISPSIFASSVVELVGFVVAEFGVNGTGREGEINCRGRVTS